MDGKPVTALIPGQNIPIETNSAYRLQMHLSGWRWGVLVIKNQHPPEHFTSEAGLAITDDQLLINLHDIDHGIEKLVIYVYTPTKNHQAVTLQADLHEVLSETHHVSVHFSKNQPVETALTLLEIYQYGTVWKIRSVCQGFKEGIGKLLALYHLNALPPTVSPAVQPADNLDAHITLSWNTTENQHTPANLYVGQDFHPVSDFRIGCFYQLRNGQSGLVYSIDRNLCGSFDGIPYIHASRSTHKHFEQLQINLRYRHKLHQYLIFVLMIEGYSHWKAHHLNINFQISGLPPQEQSPDSLMVKPVLAAAMIDFEPGEIRVTPLNEYFESLPAMDNAYGWNLPWRDPS